MATGFTAAHTFCNLNIISSPSWKGNRCVRKTSNILNNIIVESIYEGMDIDKVDIKGNKDMITNNNVDSLTCKIEINLNLKKETEDMNVEKDTTSTITETENKNGDNNFLQNSDKPKRHVKNQKKIYKYKKHHSDYDIVYSNGDPVDIDEDDAWLNHTRQRSSSDGVVLYNNIPSSDDSDETYLKPFRHNHSKSDSNLSSLPPIGRMKQSSSHVDITATQTYKEIYADNLRQYGFLLAKKLGTSNQSPDQLRKTYLRNRQKAVERRERASTEVKKERMKSDIVSPLLHGRKLSTQSNSSASSTDLTTSSKYAHSLTDISNIGIEQSRRTPTTVIRRKKHVPHDHQKRLSVPLLLENVVYADSESDKRDRKSSLLIPTRKSNSMSSLNVPDLYYSSSSDTENEVQNCEKRYRKISQESIHRQTQAKRRQEWRLSRLKSFEGVLDQANTLMKDFKTRKLTSPLASSESLHEVTKSTEEMNIPVLKEA